jgi:hypothetical protein
MPKHYAASINDMTTGMKASMSASLQTSVWTTLCSRLGHPLIRGTNIKNKFWCDCVLMGTVILLLETFSEAAVKPKSQKLVYLSQYGNWNTKYGC